jgi:hypothetical protein
MGLVSPAEHKRIIDKFQEQEDIRTGKKPMKWYGQ